MAGAAETCPDNRSVEFLLAAGPAEALRPLGVVASGGETARVMMALKAAPASVLADSGHSTEGKTHAKHAAHLHPVISWSSGAHIYVAGHSCLALLL